MLFSSFPFFSPQNNHPSSHIFVYRLPTTYDKALYLNFTTDCIDAFRL
ncbi:hypothetical protein M23134_03233 [Microscilla marina ATCC 23134]|uniref:Uncharacterized protein n=1 Tax=Microscilla marina ATCC 23134 TaxID=313606 RepID=A1ZGH8_MICM2|nr:hypothetical protein M23134_03233 [Microscilla marina ATCC 23134]